MQDGMHQKAQWVVSTALTGFTRAIVFSGFPVKNQSLAMAGADGTIPQRGLRLLRQNIGNQHRSGHGGWPQFALEPIGKRTERYRCDRRNAMQRIK
jgi:hypothetical protein